MPRLHALDGVAVLVHVEDAGLDSERVERVDALSHGAWNAGLQRVADAAETLPAAHVMHAVHGLLLEAGYADHGVLGDDLGELLFRPALGVLGPTGRTM